VSGADNRVHAPFTR